MSGEDLGPGDRGDFDRGAWHVACHLAGAGGVRRSPDGSTLWLEISHRGERDEYYASVTRRAAGRIETVPIESGEGRRLLRNSTLLGFVEGNSTGRVSARGVADPPDRFNGWRRQDFDQPVDETQDGGKVWEHWCTLRDIRETHAIGTSMLGAYVALSAALGDRFIPTIARGRRDYGHPVQLAASVYAGLTSRESALWDTTPVAIPAEAALLLLESDPARAFDAIERLDWSGGPRYTCMRARSATGASPARWLATWTPSSRRGDDHGDLTENCDQRLDRPHHARVRFGLHRVAPKCAEHLDETAWRVHLERTMQAQRVAQASGRRL